MSLAYDAEPTAYWQEAVALYRAEAAQTTDPTEAAELLVEAGEVLAEQLDAIDDAYAAFDAAQARAPEAVTPLLARARLARSQADWTEAAECYRGALGRLTGARRVPILSALARICARHLGRPEEAVRLLQEAATLAPDQRDLLIRLEAARPATETAARREVLERRLAVTTSLAERGERLAELGGLLEASVPARAARTFADAYAANPSCAAAVHGLIRTYVDLKRWRQLHRALSTHAERITDDDLRARVYAVCGVIADAHMDDADQALADLSQAGDSNDVAYERALVRDRAGQDSVDWWAQADPETAPERDWHLATAGRARLDGPLGALIDRRLALAGGDDEAAVKATAALIRQAQADEDGRALQLAACDLALWSAAPQDARPASAAAIALQADASRFPEGLVALRAISRTEADLDAWRGQINTVLQRGVETDVALAVRLWRAMNDPKPLVAEHWLELAKGDPTHIGAVDMALHLAPPSEDLSAVIDAAVAAAHGDTRRIRLLLLAAERASARGDTDTALSRWRAVLALDPLEVTARRAVGRALDAADDRDGLAALAQSELTHLQQGDDRRREAWLRRLHGLEGNPRAVSAALEGAMGELAEDWAIRCTARRHADATSDDLALQDLLSQPSASPVAARIDGLERAGVALDLGETDAARQSLDAVLADAPADVVGAWVRAQLALTEGDPAAALALTRQQLATARTPGLARIQAHRLTAQLPIAEARALMIERADEDADAAWYMLNDAAAAGDQAGVVERLEQLAQRVDPSSMDALLLEAGERAEALGLSVERRLDVWSQLVSEPAGRGTQMQLAAHAEAGNLGARVEALLALAEASEGSLRAAAYWRAGLSLEDELPLEASRFYWRAIEAWPDDPMALLLSLRVGESGAPMTGAERAQQLEAIAARLVHDGRAARMLSAAASTRASKGELARAEQDWLHAALRFPERDALAERALELLANEDEARVAFLESRVRRTTVPAARAAARHQLAREYIDVFGNREAAAAIFADIVQANPDDLAARREYARILIGLGRHRQAIEQYRTAAETVAEVSERVALYTRIGELLARHLDDLDGAIQALRQAIGLVDPTGRAQEVLAEVYLRAGEGHRALLAYQRLERMVSDPMRRAHAQAGQVRALVADDREADAAERLIQFLKKDPFEPQLNALARALDVDVPEPEIEERVAPARQTNGIDLAELDRLSAALDETQARKNEAETAVAQAKAEAAAVLDSEAFDFLAAALAEVTAKHSVPAEAAAPEPVDASEDAAPVDAPVDAAEDDVPEVEAPVDAAADDVEAVETADAAEAADDPAPLADAAADPAPLADPVPLAEADTPPAAAQAPPLDPAVVAPTAADIAALMAGKLPPRSASDAPDVAPPAVEPTADADPFASAADAPPVAHVAGDADAVSELTEPAVGEDPPAPDVAADAADSMQVADEVENDAVAVGESAIEDAEDILAGVDAIAQPVDAESVDAEPVDAEPVDAEPVDAEPVETVAESIDAEPVEAVDAPAASDKILPLDPESLEIGFEFDDEVIEEASAAPPQVPSVPPAAPIDADEFVTVDEVPVEFATIDEVPVVPPPPQVPDDEREPEKEAALADIFDNIDVGPQSVVEGEALPPPPVFGAPDPEDFEEISSIELEEWELVEVEDSGAPAAAPAPAPQRAMPPPMPLPVTKSEPIALSSDTLQALRDVHSALGDPAQARPARPAAPAPRGEAHDVLADLFARVDAAVDDDAPQSDLMSDADQWFGDPSDIADPDDSLDLALDSLELAPEDAVEPAPGPAAVDAEAETPDEGLEADAAPSAVDDLADDEPDATGDPAAPVAALAGESPESEAIEDAAADAMVEAAALDPAAEDALVEAGATDDEPADVEPEDVGALADEAVAPVLDSLEGAPAEDAADALPAEDAEPDAAQLPDLFGADDDFELAPNEPAADIKAAEPAEQPAVAAELTDSPSPESAQAPAPEPLFDFGLEEAPANPFADPPATVVLDDDDLLAAESVELPDAVAREVAETAPPPTGFELQSPTVVDEALSEAPDAGSLPPLAARIDEAAEQADAPAAIEPQLPADDFHGFEQQPPTVVVDQEALAEEPIDAQDAPPVIMDAAADDLSDAPGFEQQPPTVVVDQEALGEASAEDAPALFDDVPAPGPFDHPPSTVVIDTEQAEALRMESSPEVGDAITTSEPPLDLTDALRQDTQNPPSLDAFFADPSTGPAPAAPDLFDDDLEGKRPEPTAAESHDDAAFAFSTPEAAAAESRDDFNALLDESAEVEPPFGPALFDDADGDEPTGEFDGGLVFGALTGADADEGDDPAPPADARTPAPEPEPEPEGFISLIGAASDDFFGGEASIELADLFDDGLEPKPQPQPRVEEDSQAPSAAIMRSTRRAIERPVQRSTEPAALSVERADGAASIAARVARRNEPDSRGAQALAAVHLRRDGKLDPETARARIASNPLDDAAWASLRVASRSAGAARWIADMRSWIDGRLHAGSIIAVTSRLPDTLRDALLPDGVPRSVMRLLRALRTRIPLALAVDERPEGLAVLDANDPMTAVADRVAVALGCPMHDLMIDRLHPYSLGVVADAVPVACLGSALLARLPQQGRSFAVGRCLAALSEGTMPAEVLDDRDFGGFLAAVFHLFGVSGIDADPAATSAAVRWVRPVIDPTDTRLQALVTEAARVVDFQRIGRLRDGLISVSYRLALALSDGLGGALEAVRLLDLDERAIDRLSRDDRAEFIVSNALAEDMVQCAASVPCLAIRGWLDQNR